MWPPLFAAGVFVIMFGLLLAGLLAFLGALATGFSLAVTAFIITGILMIIASIFSSPRPEIEPENPNMKFCWFCLKEIPKDAEVCPYCTISQHKPD